MREGFWYVSAWEEGEGCDLETEVEMRWVKRAMGYVGLFSSKICVV